MSERKSIFTYIGQALDQYHADRQATTSPEVEVSPQPRRGRRMLRWLVPNGGTLLIVAVLLLTQSLWARPFQATTNAPGTSATTVNYQGRLGDNAGAPLDGTYGMTFALYNEATGGNLVWGPEEHTAVPVSDGLFSVGLGSKTDGGIPTTTWNGDRYLEITVGGETLSPRELIRSVPIAGMALTVPDGAIGASQIADGEVTQDEAPSLLKSANGNNEIVRSGNSVFDGTDADGFIEITYPCFPHGVRAFFAINGHWDANHSYVISHNGAGRCSTKIKLSSPTGNAIRINWIAIGN